MIPPSGPGNEAAQSPDALEPERPTIGALRRRTRRPAVRGLLPILPPHDGPNREAWFANQMYSIAADVHRYGGALENAGWNSADIFLALADHRTWIVQAVGSAVDFGAGFYVVVGSRES